MTELPLVFTSFFFFFSFSPHIERIEAIRCFNCYGPSGTCGYGGSMINCSPLTTFCRLEVTPTTISQACARDVHCTPESFLNAAYGTYQDPKKRTLICCSTNGCNCYGQRQCAGLRPLPEPARNNTISHSSDILRCFSCRGNAGQCLSGKLVRCPRESLFCKLESNAVSGLVSQTCARRIHCPPESFRETAFDTARNIVSCCKTSGCNCIGGQCSLLEK